MHDEIGDEVWSFLRRFFFRFVAALLLWQIVPFPLYYLPRFGPIEGLLSGLRILLVPWFGRVVFGVTLPAMPGMSGSSDQLWHWVQAAHDAAMALGIAIAWSVFDRRRKNYRRAQTLLVIYVRYYLAMFLCVYGWQKLFVAQFPLIGPERLLMPLADMSPMGLMWTFMGYSPLYQAFAGGGEVLAAVLLLHRRTATLGALVALGVMVNVVAMNLGYDVCVKLLALQLVFYALVVLAPDARRLARVFVLGRSVEPLPPAPRFTSTWLHRTSRVVKWTVAIWVHVNALKYAIPTSQQYGPNAPHAAVYGLYDVTSWRRDGVITDARWRAIGIGDNSITVQRVDGAPIYFVYDDDATAQTLDLRAYHGNTGRHVATYRVLDERRVALTLLYDGALVQLELTRRPLASTELLSRGFHWVNENAHNF